MDTIPKSLLNLKEPNDYFKGVGNEELPSPKSILMFCRSSRDELQQNAVQNRSHHRFVLCLNLKTKGHIQINHLSHPFSPGQALLIHPYQFHHFAQLDSSQLEWLFCTFELESGGFLEPLRNRVVTMVPDVQDLIRQLLDRWRAEKDAQELQIALLRILLALKSEGQATRTDMPPISVLLPGPRSTLFRSMSLALEVESNTTRGAATAITTMSVKKPSAIFCPRFSSPMLLRQFTYDGIRFTQYKVF